MTGVGFWAGAGAVLLVVGIALLVWDVRRDRS
jgi:hypothetical protein